MASLLDNSQQRVVFEGHKEQGVLARCIPRLGRNRGRSPCAKTTLAASLAPLATSLSSTPGEQSEGNVLVSGCGRVDDNDGGAGDGRGSAAELHDLELVQLMVQQMELMDCDENGTAGRTVDAELPIGTLLALARLARVAVLKDPPLVEVGGTLDSMAT